MNVPAGSGRKVACWLVYLPEWSSCALPPHIKVKAPNSLSESKWWLPQVAALYRRFSPLPVVLDGMGQFSSTVLYWRVTSPSLAALHHALLKLINPPPAERSLYLEGRLTCRT